MVRQSKTVLFIDDERNALAGWSLYLQGVGYTVVSASCAQEGLEFFATKKVDVVVLDHRMPDMNGDEAAAQMKCIKPEVVIVMFSGDPEAVCSEHPSIDAFLLKGKSPSLLLNRLDALLKVDAEPQESAYPELRH
jgi:CheY-like chemotaxis protein